MEKNRQKYRLYPTLVTPDEMNVIMGYLEKQPLHIAANIVRQDLVGIAESLSEMIYALFLISHRYGLPIESLIEEIHRSKMKEKKPMIAAALEPHIRAKNRAEALDGGTDKVSEK